MTKYNGDNSMTHNMNGVKFDMEQYYPDGYCTCQYCEVEALDFTDGDCVCLNCIEDHKLNLSEQPRYTKAQDKNLKLGAMSECSECHSVRTVAYLYGGKYPLCIGCAKRILN